MDINDENAELDRQNLKLRIIALETERAGIWLKMQPLQDRLSEIYSELKPLVEKEAALWLIDMGDEPTPENWKQIIKELADGPRSSQALLRFTEKRLREKFHMYHSGYWSETREAAFKLMIPKKGEFELRKNIEGVKFFTPLYTPLPDGWVHFDIFEHSLSYGGSYHLLVKPDLSQFTLQKTTYGRKEMLKSFKTVEDALGYIQKNHWYGDSDEETEDED